MSVSLCLCFFVCFITPPKQLILMSWNFEGWFPLGCRWLKAKKLPDSANRSPKIWKNAYKDSNNSHHINMLPQLPLFWQLQWKRALYSKCYIKKWIVGSTSEEYATLDLDEASSNLVGWKSRQFCSGKATSISLIYMHTLHNRHLVLFFVYDVQSFQLNLTSDQISLWYTLPSMESIIFGMPPSF